MELSPGHRMHHALALSREMKLPPLATSRAVLLDENDWELHRVLRAIALNSKLSRLTAADTAHEGDLPALRKAHGRLFSPLSRSRREYPAHCPKLPKRLGFFADGVSRFPQFQTEMRPSASWNAAPARA